MEQFNRKNLPWFLPLLAVEGATAWNLGHYYFYHEPVIAAALLALSFSAMLVGTAFLVTQELGATLRGLLIAGGMALFLAQAMANMSEAFLRAQGMLPADRLAQFWNTTPGDWTIHSSIIYGSIINLVGGVYWIALSTHFKRESERQRRAQERLQAFLQAERG